MPESPRASPSSLRNRTAIVTGGGTHLGTAMAATLAELGAAVYIASRRGKLCEEVAAGLRSQGLDVTGAGCDATDEAQVDALVDRVMSEHGRLDVFICNAGGSVTSTYPPNASIDEFRQTLEINLVSNLLLEYVEEYSQHPFPEYLRLGVPVALSTDDRGMWDSNLTDEYFVAVKEFNLSWDELMQLGRNSLKYSFLDEPTKQKLLAAYEKRVQTFAQQFQNKGWAAFKDVKPVSYSFLCKHYELCLR